MSVISISSVACRAGAKYGLHEAFGDDCKIETQDKIEWEVEPTLTEDGYLVLSGTTKGGAGLHQAQEQVVSMVGTDLVATFVPTFALAQVDEELLKLVPTALIWPPDVVEQLELRSEMLNLVGQRDAYFVTDDSFEIKVHLPAHIQNQDGRLAVQIWPAMMYIDPDTVPLGAKCIKQE